MAIAAASRFHRGVDKGTDKAMHTRRKGFTLVEMVIVLMVSAVLLGIGTRQYTKVSDQRAAVNARDAFISTSLRARSEALRSGRLVYLRVRTGPGEVDVWMSPDEVLHEVQIGDFGATMVGNDLSVCYAARGYALPGCTTSDSDQVIHFVRGVDTASVMILPLGQVQGIQ